MRRQRPTIPACDTSFDDDCAQVERKKIKLLIIDDQEGYCDLVREQADLSDHQYDIDSRVADSEEGVDDLLKEWSPTVVLVDAHLPDVDCFALLQRLKDGAIPVIVTGVSCSRAIEASVLAHGASAYVTKSENPDDLERLMERVAEASCKAVELH